MYQEKEFKKRELQLTKNHQKIETTPPAPVKNVINTPLMQQNIDLRIKKRILNHPTGCSQSNIIQKKPMPLKQFAQEYIDIYNNYFNSASKNKIWRFTSNPDEKIGYACNPGDVCEQVTGQTKANKPLSFLHNINAILATALSGKGDSNILTYINNADKLCSIELSAYDTLVEKGFGIWVAAANELTLMETECVLGAIKNLDKNSPDTLTKLASTVNGISIIDNPFKGKIKNEDMDSPDTLTKLENDTYSNKDCSSTGLSYNNIEEYLKFISTYSSNDTLSHNIGSEKRIIEPLKKHIIKSKTSYTE